jgi:hypothetical protein
MSINVSTFDVEKELERLDEIRSRSSGCEGHDKSDSNVSKKKVMGGRDPEGHRTETSFGYRIVKLQWVCEDCGKRVAEEDIRGGRE